jgi:hypothetical protein
VAPRLKLEVIDGAKVERVMHRDRDVPGACGKWDHAVLRAEFEADQIERFSRGLERPGPVAETQLACESSRYLFLGHGPESNQGLADTLAGASIGCECTVQDGGVDASGLRQKCPEDLWSIGHAT